MLPPLCGCWGSRPVDIGQIDVIRAGEEGVIQQGEPLAGCQVSLVEADQIPAVLSLFGQEEQQAFPVRRPNKARI